MNGCIITVKSITYALKGEALLKKRGIPCKIVKPDVTEGGCKYGIGLSCTSINAALEILKHNAIEIGRIMA